MANIIEKLQSLDSQSKQKVLIGGTVLVMLVVIYFWLAYFNNLIAGTISQPPVADVSQGGTASTSTAPVVTTNTPDVFQGMRNTMAFIGQAFTNFFKGIADIFKGPRQYIVQP